MKRLMFLLAAGVASLCFISESQAALFRRSGGCSSGCSSSGGCSTGGGCSVASSGCSISGSSGCNISQSAPQAVTVAQLPPTPAVQNPAVKALFDAAAGASRQDECDGESCPLKPAAKAPVKTDPAGAQRLAVEPRSAFAFCATPEFVPSPASAAFASFRSGE